MKEVLTQRRLSTISQGPTRTSLQIGTCKQASSETLHSNVHFQNQVHEKIIELFLPVQVQDSNQNLP